MIGDGIKCVSMGLSELGQRRGRYYPLWKM